MFDRFKNRGGDQPIPAEPQLPPAANGEPAVDSSAPYTEPTSLPITFDNEQAADIYDAAAEGTEGSLAQALFRRPVDKLSLRLNSTAGYFALYGSVEYKDKDTAEKVYKRLTDDLERRAQATDKPTDERGGTLIVTGQEDTQLVVARGRYYSDERKILVTTGPIAESYDSTIDVLPPVKLERQVFDRALSDVLGTLALTLGVSYEVTKATPLPEVVPVTPPKARKRASLMGENDEDSARPEDISSKFGGEHPKVTFDDIGGQEKAKHEIEGLAFAISRPDLYEKWGTKPPKGILLHGPPGTGKTLLAKALASQADAAFYAIKSTDIGSKWYGSAEKRTEEIFTAAAENERAIVYFDELDAIVPNREGGHEATQRVVSVILQHMDGIHAKDNVMILASTNRIGSIDSAMLRPGRLDRLIEVELPDKAGRHQIFSIHMKQANERAKRQLFEEDVDPDLLATMTETRSGADIAEIIRRVLENKVRIEGTTETEPPLVSAKEIADEIAAFERTIDKKQ